MHARALLSIHHSPPPLVTRPRIHVLFTLLFIALSSLLLSFVPVPLHAAPRLATCPTGSVIYVAKEAPGIQSGNSWFTAFVTLQDALAAAATCPGVQQIWVKEGIYYPDEGKGQVANSTAAAFVVPPGVVLYGGFGGSELLLTQRSWPDHPTILSGDVDGNDTNTDGNFIAEASSQIQGATAYHVLWLNGTRGTPITDTTRIDGFTITAVDANASTATGKVTVIITAAAPPPPAPGTNPPAPDIYDRL